MTIAGSDLKTLLETIETQRFGCEMAGSPLYSDLLEVVSDDVERNGPFAALLEPVTSAPFGDAVLLRLLGALHLLVLEGGAPDLARHYPSVGGSPASGLRADAIDAADRHAAVLAEAMQRGVQTNEVGRSAALLGGYLEASKLGLPLRVLEVGASAGLNLLFDRYRYTWGDGAFGPADSPLLFDRPWFSRHPDLEIPLEVLERRGSDIAPIDLMTTSGRARLRSFVWADQLERLARLDAAIEVAMADPPIIDAAPAAMWLHQQLAEPAPGSCTVVTHSIMFQYLSAPERTEMLDVIEDAGLRADAASPLVWLRLEPGGDQAELRYTAFPGGDMRVLATSAYHGPPVVWRG